MKVYIGYKRKGEGKIISGVTVYNETSKILFSNIRTCDDMSKDKGKFANALSSLIWGIKQVKTQAQRGSISEEEKLYIVLDNKTVYNWFENGSSIRSYAIEFAELNREINFLVNDVEVILSIGSSKKVTYKRKGTIEDEGLIKLTDMFK